MHWGFDSPDGNKCINLKFIAMADLFNRKLAQKMQSVSDKVWESVAFLLPCGSYTANDVYKFFTKEKGFSAIMNELHEVCHEDVEVELGTFKCKSPKYLFFNILHKIETLGGLIGKKRKVFIREADAKQTELQTETKINNPITPIFMAAERYEGTEPFYQLDKIENGEFRVKGSHDSDLVLFLRTAAHYIRRQGAMMQSEFCAYCSKQLEGKDWRSMVPMEELALAEMFEGFLASKGVNDIPDVEFEDVMEELTDEVDEEVVEEPISEVEEAEEVEEVEAEEVEDIQEAEEVIEEVEEPQTYVLCITGTLNKSRKFYQEQIEKRGWRLAGKMSTSVDILVYGDSQDEQASTKIKQAIKHGTKAISAEEFYQMLDEHPVEVEDVVGETEVAIKPMAIEKEIVPTLELETSEGTLIVAGDSYFHKLYDEENGCFRSEAAEAKFNEIDAFIPDELITAEVLDYAAIAQAVGEFMEEVEQAS